MAGRPKKQYERIQELNSRVAILYRDLDQLTPEMHKQRAGSGDRLGEAWITALEAAGDAWRAIYGLRTLLAARARIGVLAERESNVGDYAEESSNPAADNCTEDSVIVVDGTSATLEQWAREFNRPIAVVLERVRSGLDWESAIMDPVDLADDTVIAAVRNEESVSRIPARGRDQPAT